MKKMIVWMNFDRKFLRWKEKKNVENI